MKYIILLLFAVGCAGKEPVPYKVTGVIVGKQSVSDDAWFLPSVCLSLGHHEYKAFGVERAVFNAVQIGDTLTLTQYK
jgi:hypothetical protein